MRPAFILSTPDYDKFFADPNWQSWFRFNCPAVGGYSPSFDPVTKWHSGAVCYFDLYAIREPGQWILPQEFYTTTDGEYILKDAAGQPVKINWKEADGSYKQYAADISNPAFVQEAIGKLQALLKLGYKGFFLDDANLNPSFVSATDQPIPSPVDVGLWRDAMLRYLREIRKSFPSAILIHNTPWRDTIEAQWPLLDYFNFEGGFGWITSQADAIKMSQLIRNIHLDGKRVIVEEYLKANLPTSLPCFDAVSNPGDLIAVEDMMPNEWGV